MKYVTLLFVVFGVALGGCAPQATQGTDEAAAPAQDALEGVWRIVEVAGTNAEGDWTTQNVQPSLYIFMDGYYSMQLVRGDEPRPLMPEGTTWEVMTLEQYRSICAGEFFSANTGAYEVDGASLTVRPVVAKWPNLMTGGSLMYTYRIEDGSLHLLQESDGSIWRARLIRLN